MKRRSIDELIRLRDKWFKDGTYRRIEDAVESKTPLKIRRSSGEMVDGLIARCDLGGVSCVVAWGPGSDQATTDAAGVVRFPCPVHNKRVDMAEIVDWNPWLSGKTDA